MRWIGRGGVHALEIPSFAFLVTYEAVGAARKMIDTRETITEQDVMWETKKVRAAYQRARIRMDHAG
jgi:hypothetical protein